MSIKLWDKTLETGIATIDEQHRELFRRIDNLLDVKNQNRVGETLNFLDEYIIRHFTDEQNIMTAAGYPKAAIHKGYHDAYIREFRALKAKIEQEGVNLVTTIAINKSVVDWLRNHIMVHDREFAQFYQIKK